MKFQVVHEIQYDFTRPVFLEPHTLRLRPRHDGWQSIESFELELTPTPQGLWHELDLEGNAISLAWFNGLHSSLSIVTKSIVETSRSNPFAFLISGKHATLPMLYPPDEEQALKYARQPAEAASEADEIGKFAKLLLADAGGQVMPFLWLLTQRIHSDWTVFRREHGAPWSPAETFRERAGACRDLVVLFLEVCRRVGLAARFVSGYYCHLQEGEPHDLHAWAEVYLPGAGWIGYDPTAGLAVADHHVPLVAAVRPEHTMPASGTFRGTSATASLGASITISSLEAAASTQFMRQTQPSS